MSFTLTAEATGQATGRPARPTDDPAPIPPAGSSGTEMVERRSPVTTVVAHTLMILVCLFSVVPIYWMFLTALRTPADTLSPAPWTWPPTLQNFAYVWRAIPMATMLASTLAMALAVAAGQLVVAILASYGFAFHRFPGRQVIMMAFIGSWLVPFQLTMIPNYLVISNLGVLNTVAGVVLPQLCSAFSVLLMNQHMTAFPTDLVDAAKVEGASSLGVLWRVVLPNMKAPLAAVAIMLFVSAWNEYLWPSLVLQKNQMALVQVGVRSFLGAEGNNWGATMAAAALACLPVLIIYVFLRRYVVSGFVRSGLR